MSRPKPTILLHYTDPRTYKADQVLKADAIYAVFYDEQAINLRTLTDTILVEKGAKYRKVSFSNSGHAFNLAERLNKMFKTDKFKVMKLTQGVVITEDDGE
jgi:hypothetical protein